ncbi:MAG: hypothetical protein NDI60_06635 [Elusimicrobiales bacterium]|nr:hypothetical protein [Elusimicrobiales bacterium]
MKNLGSLVGWTLLLAVLAVPSFLFYNWWTENKRQASAETAAEPVQANIFPAAEKDRPAAEPVAAAPAQPLPAVAARPAAIPAPQPAQKPAAAPAAPAASPAPEPAPAVAEVKPQGQAVQASTSAFQPVAVSSGPKPVSYYAPKSDRDPVLSPADYSRIKEAELRRRELERQQRAASRKPSEPQIESRLKLQGIVGSAAIINGEMYSAGQTVYGARILKVGADYVIGEYKGRKFRKVLK